MNSYKIYDKIIIGGGASGMMTAIYSARKGYRTLIVEANDMLGKKIYATGNGKCNFTNLDQDLSNYICDDIDFFKNIINKTCAFEFIEFLNGLGIESIDKDGYVYPASEQAKHVVSALKHAIKTNDKIDVLYDCEVKKIEHKEIENRPFVLQVSSQIFECKNMIIATGLSASVFSHKNCFAKKVADKFSIKFINELPALVGLKTNEKHFDTLAGVRQNAVSKLIINEIKVSKEVGNIQFNPDNVSGIPIMQESIIATKALKENKKVEIVLDFSCKTSNEKYKLPIIDFKKRIEILKEDKAKNMFNGLLSEKLGIFILRQLNIPEYILVKELRADQLNKIENKIHNFKIKICDTCGFEKAQTCRGGVDLEELKFNLEAKKVRGLYFVGEAIDITGKCGGYNLQLCFSTAKLAGTSAL